MNTLRIYVAAPWEYRKQAKEVMERLDQYSRVKITHDWTDEPAIGTDRDKACASLDLTGVEQADCLLMLVEEKSGCGMWVEMGYALRCGIPVFMVPLHKDADAVPYRSIFQSLPGVTCYPFLGTFISEQL